MVKQYFIYILTNKYDTVLYIGISNNLVKRVWQHKNKLVKGFTFKYNVNKLIYYEVFTTSRKAIKREKQVKGWTRQKKVDLIKKENPKFEDLYQSIL